MDEAGKSSEPLDYARANERRAVSNTPLYLRFYGGGMFVAGCVVGGIVLFGVTGSGASNMGPNGYVAGIYLAGAVVSGSLILIGTILFWLGWRWRVRS